MAEPTITQTVAVLALITLAGCATAAGTQSGLTNQMSLNGGNDLSLENANATYSIGDGELGVFSLQGKICAKYEASDGKDTDCIETDSDWDDAMTMRVGSKAGANSVTLVNSVSGVQCTVYKGNTTVSCGK